jgi:hypothetical protein
MVESYTQSATAVNPLTAFSLLPPTHKVHEHIKNNYDSDVRHPVGSVPLDIGRISPRCYFDDGVVVEIEKNRRAPARVVVSENGIKVVPTHSHVHSSSDGAMIGGGRRGEVYGFSSSSRRRMRAMLLTLDLSGRTEANKRAKLAMTYFVTLTYGRKYPQDWERFKRDIDTFRKRLDRKMPPGWSAIWKLEYQQRGAPHYHILLFLPQKLSSEWLRRFVRSSWVAIASTGYGYTKKYVRKMRAVVDSGGVVPVYQKENQPGRLLSYLLKYMSKETDRMIDSDGVYIQTGRSWGVWNKENLPRGQTYSLLALTLHDFKSLILAVRRRGRSIGSRYLSSLTGRVPFTVYGSGADLLSQLLQESSARLVPE